MKTFDLTPDPKVLIALTHTPLQPLDALCELIDNSIDSFKVAVLKGVEIAHPLIIIDLPRRTELENGAGKIMIRDNGPGMSLEDAEKSIRAGFSGNNPYDTLGLFGMGFNISTGKLGRETVLSTHRAEDETSLTVKIDLDDLMERSSYNVPIIHDEKESDFRHGTKVEISKWWPEGNPNSGFIKKLIQYGMPVIRKEIGRRYATILKANKIRININGEACEPYEHCAWASKRYVEKKGHGQIPAQFHFDEVVGSQMRCTSCSALLTQGEKECPSCGSGNVRTISERVHGWVGIQRFDDANLFGIDIIRNGRVIRVAEKRAFFEFVDEFQKSITDYPIDGPFGRIIGEVHLDHVPVDFLKKDFQRSSPEWIRAISFLRGDSSLQPTQPGADSNHSPLYKLFQGYRRVRTPGKSDMYMGYWDQEKRAPRRISRDVEKEYYEKFIQKTPGFYDDSEWWELVEKADRKPVDELVKCPVCTADNLKEHEVCQVCGKVMIGKTCINDECKENIARSASVCPACGVNQLPTIEEPWTCGVCKKRNRASNSVCESCESRKGEISPLSREYLLENSNKDDGLSFPGCSVKLPDNTYSNQIEVWVYVTKDPIIVKESKEMIPLVIFKGEEIEIFIDVSHNMFRSYNVRPEEVIASEIAMYVYDTSRNLTSGTYERQHNISNIKWEIIRKRWEDVLEDDADKIKNEISDFFNQFREKLPDIFGEEAYDMYDDLKEDEINEMVQNMLSNGEDISNLEKKKKTGQYLLFVNDEVLLKIFKQMPEKFFDGNFWDEAYSRVDGLPGAAHAKVKKYLFSMYLNCFEDITNFSSYKKPDVNITKRARTSINYLLRRMV